MIWRVLACVLITSFCLYLYVHQSNELTELRLKLPALADELLVAQEKNETLRYEIESVESPLRLLELSRAPEYGHLRHPHTDEVWVIE